jgi:molybdopterin-guanine dinucleotide biosynthesis protein B
MAQLPPIVAFAAPSGTGKTTLIERVVRDLVARGLRVGVLKADAHRVVLDTPGKDSFRFAEAGAAPVAVLSAERLALFERLEGEVSLVSAVDRLFPGADIVLVEGFRRSGVPTVRVHRAAGPATAGWEPPRNVIAWASDDAPETALPVFPLAEPGALVGWLVGRFTNEPTARAPTVVCPLVDPARFAEAEDAALRIAALVGGPAMIVTARGIVASGASGCRVVGDLKSGLGLLGALYTGLAAADTPEILLVGPRYWDAVPALLPALLQSRRTRADIVHGVVDGHAEPALAVYGHRCLPAIQSAVLSGELKLTGWWGQVRTLAIPGSVSGARAQFS